MKKILVLTPTLPYPPVSGGVIKSNKVIQFLLEHYSVSVACFLKNEDPLYQQEFKVIFPLQNFIAEELNVTRNAINLIKSNILGIPLNLYRNKSKTFKEKIKAIIHQHDVVFCDHYVMFQYIPEDYKGKIILHEHNCEYLIWKRYAAIEQNIAKKLALLNQAYRIKRYEQEICAKAHVVLAAPNDQEELVKIGADANKFMETYHLGDDSLLQAANIEFSKTKKSLLYIGTLSWEANIDGLLWFYDKVWPILKKQDSELTLSIIGKHADARLQEMAAKDDDIILTGFVEDVEPYFQQHRVFITPLRFGSGIKVKVVNALYRGIPCVTTSIGAEGLKVKDAEHLFIKDTPEAYAAAIQKLLTDEECWNAIRNNAREIANQYYTWHAVLATIKDAVEK
ncbi:MAG TPA: glycosyltransferase family 4 protein [Chitinophagales bacterium]|nr:glycosyltransferase family 4 protein [Chitinophagales bacterium]